MYLLASKIILSSIFSPSIFLQAIHSMYTKLLLPKKSNKARQPLFIISSSIWTKGNARWWGAGLDSAARLLNEKCPRHTQTFPACSAGARGSDTAFSSRGQCAFNPAWVRTGDIRERIAHVERSRSRFLSIGLLSAHYFQAQNLKKNLAKSKIKR